MIRVGSALVLVGVVVGTTWWLPPVATLVLAEVVLLVAVVEYLDLAARLGTRPPAVVVALAGAATCAAVGRADAAIEAVLMASTISVGAVAIASGGQRSGAPWPAAVAMFAPLYLGLPLGALVAMRSTQGSEVVLLLLATVIASDTAQYYGGRAYGRRLLAPAISPKKTVEGAITGLAAGTLVLVVVGRWWLPTADVWLRAALGAALAAVGIVGDLFESRLKREAGMKDTSGLIPGHGGMLDRLDSLLFAAPLYYIVLQGI